MEDGALAARMGADAVGMIMQEGARRYVEVGVARDIVRGLPPFVTPVGVFVNAAGGKIREVAGEIGLRSVQLHGAEGEAEIAELADFLVMKAIKVDQRIGEEIRKWSRIAERHAHFRGLVLETGGTAEAGGTGVENDWTAIAKAMAESGNVLPIVVAGGLRPDNVEEVVRRLRPYAVDVSSGVEESLRVKSARKVEDFIEGSRRGDLVGGSAT